jgi:biotin synthase-like enzyme
VNPVLLFQITHNAGSCGDTQCKYCKGKAIYSTGYKARRLLEIAVLAMETHKTGRFITAVTALVIASVAVRNVDYREN